MHKVRVSKLELQITQYTVPVARRILLVNGHRDIILNQNQNKKPQPFR